jgi:hypothetical protein
MMLLNTMHIEVVSLDSMKDLYAEDTYFTKAWKYCREPWGRKKKHIYISTSKRDYFLRMINFIFHGVR